MARLEARAPSMVDVAREAGVGLATVSRVLNSPASVRPATRDRVHAAIGRLGYRRNEVARALKGGRSGTLGVVLAGAELFELPRVLRGMEDAADHAGLRVTLTSWRGGPAEDLAAVIDRLTREGVEGVAVIADRPLAAAALEEVAARTPLAAVMSGSLGNTAISSIEVDQELGARLATEHLLTLDHRRIAHLTGRLDTHDARARLAGWRAAMAAAGIDAPAPLEGDFTAESGHRLTRVALRTPPRPTAIVAGNDQMALGALSALAEAGVDVPGEVSVVGFDDMPGAAYLVPALTTVRQDFALLGRTAIEQLVATIAGDRPRHCVLTPELVTRASAGPA